MHRVSIEEEAQVSSSPSSDHILLSETSSNSSNHQVNLRPSVSEGALSGKGIPLSRVPSHVPLYMIEFKSGRTGFYYLSDVSLSLEYDDLVIVEADRGRDLGKVATQVLTADQVVLLDKRHSAAGQKHDVSVKRIHRLATLNEVQMLTTKELDEQKALSLCLQKIKHRKLEMEIVDAEFQWDRRKLTFYFIAEKRIDFRELVRELFKTYKTRIWM
ncbi:PSP1 C-terminal conserved region-domain-containing protein [Blakeslea trispora]|nr:PSP1 C-terminal conserved region-domain-containing protein [Blakeslea trispora]